VLSIISFPRYHDTGVLSEESGREVEKAGENDSERMDGSIVGDEVREGLYLAHTICHFDLLPWFHREVVSCFHGSRLSVVKVLWKSYRARDSETLPRKPHASAWKLMGVSVELCRIRSMEANRQLP